MSRLRLGEASVCLLLIGCEPALRVGDLQCSPGPGAAATKNGNGVYNEGLLPAPWQTSFDDGFCDYQYLAGFCYSDSSSSYRLVSAPVHTGPFAAAFDLSPSKGRRTPGALRARGTAAQRSVLQRLVLRSERPFRRPRLEPIPRPRRTSPREARWALGRVAGRREWRPERLCAEPSGRPPLPAHQPEANPPSSLVSARILPKERTDATGAVALHQDGEELLRVTNAVTNDTPFSQWYVGNFAGNIPPNSPTSTLYVDDVSVRLP